MSAKTYFQMSDQETILANLNIVLNLLKYYFASPLVI
jgi:hypothetical protein